MTRTHRNGNDAPARQTVWLRRGAVAAIAAWLATSGIATTQRRSPQPADTIEDSAEALPTQPGCDVWIDHAVPGRAEPVRLHGRWLAQPAADAPVLLYLHGVRSDLGRSALRLQRLHALGFAVLGVDYRGFGRSTPGQLSERSACEDALAAWQWLAEQHPQARRFIHGHSLGGAIAVQLAALVDDAAGLIVENTFTSIPELLRGFRFGGRPLAALITDRFDAAARVPQVRAPVLVVHGSADRLVRPELGRDLYERATAPKRFLLVPGGSHRDTHALGQAQYREALRELFGLVV